MGTTKLACTSVHDSDQSWLIRSDATQHGTPRTITSSRNCLTPSHASLILIESMYSAISRHKCQAGSSPPPGTKPNVIFVKGNTTSYPPQSNAFSDAHCCVWDLRNWPSGSTWDHVPRKLAKPCEPKGETLWIVYKFVHTVYTWNRPVYSLQSWQFSLLNKKPGVKFYGSIFCS